MCKLNWTDYYGYFDDPDPDHARAANELTIMGWDAVSKQPFLKFAAVRIKAVADAEQSHETLPEQVGNVVGRVVETVKDVADAAKARV